MQRCMQYAVEHNHEVKRAEWELDSYKASRTGAVGRWLPSVNAGVGAQYNFGRAIDPETNGYTDVSTFYNGYSLNASLPIFDGFSRLHALRAAEASVLMGKSALRQQQDQTALNAMQAFVQVAYYEGLVEMAEEKVEETTLMLKQTRVLEEVGRKSATDVAQMESQQAEADYELTHQRNLLASALLELKKTMAFPLSDTLSLSMPKIAPKPTSPMSVDRLRGGRLTDIGEVGFGGVYSLSADTSFSAGSCAVGQALNQAHPELLSARYQMQSAKHEWHQARAELFPILSLSAGLSTTYYHTLHVPSASSFRNQFHNNMGEYIGATLSIPLFNRLQTLTGIRRAKNNYQMACEAYEQKHLELEKLSREAWMDWVGYQEQTEQMQKKVAADSLAYRLTRRQFEEGLSTAIDLHTLSSQWLQSKATLLQCQLMVVVKEQLVKYYRGEQIWTE